MESEGDRSVALLGTAGAAATAGYLLAGGARKKSSTRMVTTTKRIIPAKEVIEIHEQEI